jgi:hypothetical protein
MNRIIFTTLLALLLSLAAAASAQCDGDGVGSGNGVCQFVDEDGDGFNDLAPDADGDGIPNGLDPDYVPAADGEGNRHMYKKGQVSDDGSDEGLIAGFGATEKVAGDGLRSGNAYGLGDGTGSGVGPADGTGFGPGDGTGDCDGTTVLSGGVQQRRSGRR